MNRGYFWRERRNAQGSSEVGGLEVPPRIRFD